MLDDKSQAEVNAATRSTRIIVFGLCAGIVVFGTFALFFQESREKPVAGVITYMSLVFAGLQAILSFIIPRIVVGRDRKQIAAGTWNAQSDSFDKTDTDAGKLAVVYRTSTIIGCALLEGAAFFTLIANIVEGHSVTLIVALLILVGVALHMPLDDRVTAWVETQLQIIDDDRRFLR